MSVVRHHRLRWQLPIAHNTLGLALRRCVHEPARTKRLRTWCYRLQLHITAPDVQPCRRLQLQCLRPASRSTAVHVYNAAALNAQQACVTVQARDAVVRITIACLSDGARCRSPRTEMHFAKPICACAVTLESLQRGKLHQEFARRVEMSMFYPRGAMLCCNAGQHSQQVLCLNFTVHTASAMRYAPAYSAIHVP